MQIPHHESSYLLRRFRAFYREVVRLRRMVESTLTEPAPETALVAAAAGAASGTVASPEPVVPAGRVETHSVVQGVWQQLLTLLERQAIEAGQSGGAFAFEVYREAQYVMAALADETFLNLNWEGRASWPLLESKLFQSHIAGEAIFDQLDRLLQRRDPFYLDLAAVYFMALSLGFQGKYRGTEETGRLEQYRRQLFVMIHRRNPRLFAGALALFPQNQTNVIEDLPRRKLPPARMWLLLVAGVLLLWVIASQYTWSAVSNDVSCLMCRVLNTNCSCQAGGGQ